MSTVNDLPETAEPTVEQMLTSHDAESGPRDGSLSAALAAVRHGAGEDDVSVTVDLHGALVGLTLGPRAVRMRATELAALIQRLVTTAAAAALADGLAVLAASGACDQAVLAELAERAAVASSG